MKYLGGANYSLIRKDNVRAGQVLIIFFCSTVFFFRNVSALPQGAERHKDSEIICVLVLALR